MSEERKLELEVLSGPLDGVIIPLAGGADWTRDGEGSLAFPWDDELGEPQARFKLDEGGWSLEGFDAPHGTYRVNEGERVSARIQLARGDLLKASNTWLLVQRIE